VAATLAVTTVKRSHLGAGSARLCSAVALDENDLDKAAAVQLNMLRREGLLREADYHRFLNVVGVYTGKRLVSVRCGGRLRFRASTRFGMSDRSPFACRKCIAGEPSGRSGQRCMDHSAELRRV
jgi:hypothetical protein